MHVSVGCFIITVAAGGAPEGGTAAADLRGAAAGDAGRGEADRTAGGDRKRER